MIDINDPEFPLLEPGLGEEHDDKRLLAGPLPTGFCSALPEEAMWDPPLCLLPVGGAKGLWSGAVCFDSSQRQGPWRSDLWAAEASSRDVEC